MADSSMQSNAGGKSSDIKTPANANLPKTGGDPKVFDANGAVGHQFTEKGVFGSAAQAIGGPLDKEGVIGKQFTTDGGIGGSVQNVAGGKK